MPEHNTKSVLEDYIQPNDLALFSKKDAERLEALLLAKGGIIGKHESARCAVKLARLEHEDIWNVGLVDLYVSTMYSIKKAHFREQIVKYANIVFERAPKTMNGYLNMVDVGESEECKTWVARGAARVAEAKPEITGYYISVIRNIIAPVGHDGVGAGEDAASPTKILVADSVIRIAEYAPDQLKNYFDVLRKQANGEFLNNRLASLVNTAANENPGKLGYVIQHLGTFRMDQQINDVIGLDDFKNSKNIVAGLCFAEVNGLDINDILSDSVNENDWTERVSKILKKERRYNPTFDMAVNANA